MKSRKKDIVLALILTICIICFAIIVTVFCKQLYYFDIDYLHIVSDTGLSKEIIQKNYDILIQYQCIFYRGELNLPNFVMSESGRIHFEEVKRIFDIIQIVFIITASLSSYMIYTSLKEKEYRFLPLTSLFSIGIPSILGLLASVDFNQAFILFHKIVFRNDYWIFDYRTDPVITILPETFFMHCFFMIISIVIIISLCLYGIYIKKKKEILNQYNKG